MSLVVFSGACGVFLAPIAIHPFIALITVLCIALGSGASGAINMWYDRDIDQVMTRTKNRPIPAGRVDPNEALSFGIIIAITSVVLLLVATNIAAASILLAAILFYVFIYTIWLKRRTPQNIVIGGAAGAFPPMIGWAAATGDISAMPILLFAIIFFWTPPHFWALSLLIKDDYKNAAVPMLPVVAGVEHTKLNILLYSVILLPIAIAPYFLGFAGLAYLVASLALNIYFIYCALRLYLLASNETELDQATKSWARKTFLFSILYLFAIFATLVADKTLF